jgi:hypothetical protein
MALGEIVVFGAYFVALPAILIQGLFSVLFAATPTAAPVPLAFGLLHVALPSADAQLMALVLIMGCLGGYAHALLAFTAREPDGSRALWYIFGPVIGVVLALIFYLVVRAGFLSGNAADSISAPGVAAMSALVGLFSREAVTRLRRMFAAMGGEPEGQAHSSKAG